MDGFARGGDGKSHEGAQVIVVPPDLTRRKARNAWTDASGHFKVEGLAPGRHNVRVFPRHVEGADEREEEKRWLLADAEVREGEVTRVEFPVEGRPGCVVRGRVLRGTTPVEGAEVRLTPLRTLARAERIRLGDRLHDLTRADGSYRLEGAPAGPAGLGVYLEDGDASVYPWTNCAFRIEVPDAADFAYDALLPSGEISGRVVLAGDGRPLPGVALFADPFDSENPRFLSTGAARSGPDGGYRIRDLPAGTWRVRTRLDGSESTRAAPLLDLLEEEKGPVEIGEGEKATVDFALATGGAAVVSVRDPAGRPVPRAGVVVFPDGSEPFETLGGARGVHGRTDESGVARVRGLAPGLHVARVLWSGWASGDSEPRLVRAGEETEFAVVVKAGTRVRFRLVDGRGEAIGQGIVRVRDSEGRVVP
ncbi:MAG: MSCRAMM family protein, partial [Planctomycetota bacterium]